jgi:DNA processing protein
MEGSIQQLLPKDFPLLLKEIPDPPKKLYLRGNLPSTDLTWIAVVGSRKYTSYGKQVVEHLIKGLSGAPVVIVSGLALGTDSLAHRAAIDNNLPTVAIPGSGLDDSVLYPRTNVSLSRSILESGGALLSEFEPNFKATLWGFPRRNRIMAGISHATLLIEAAPKSGTLITARLANEYNREVFVVPNSIFSESSKGVHQFLRLGATPVTSADDILDALSIKKSNEPKELGNLTGDEHLVLTLIANPISRDDLLRALKKPISEAQVLLSTMELKGLITEHMGIMRAL